MTVSAVFTITPVLAVNGAGQRCILVHDDPEPNTIAHVGQHVQDQTGTIWAVTGGSAPMHEGSTGRVFVEGDGGEQRVFFPAVFGMRWMPLPPKQEQSHA